MDYEHACKIIKKYNIIDDHGILRGIIDPLIDPSIKKIINEAIAELCNEWDYAADIKCEEK